MNELWVGVDIAKANFEVAWWDVGQGQALSVGNFANTPEGIAALGAQVAERARQSGVAVIHLVVEATGGYELPLVAWAHAQGWRVSLPNPKQVRDWAKGVGLRGKTDQLDARLLARYGAERRPQPSEALPEEVQRLESLLARREDLEHMRQQERNRLAALTGRPGVAQQVPSNVQSMLAALDQAVAEMDQAIADLLDQHPHLRAHKRRLLSVPGIGAKTVLPILVLLYRWQALTQGRGDPKGLTAYLGLDPQPFQSGSSVRKRPGISRQGNRPMRSKAVMAALGGTRSPTSPLGEFYRRLVGRGKPKMVALIACARKLIVWGWAVFRDEVPFDRARFEPFVAQPS